MHQQHRKTRRASLNHNFRLVWSSVHHMYVAVAEHCRGHGKTSSTVQRAVAALLLSLGGAAHAVGSGALPTGAQVSAGQAQISQSGTVMNVDQSSQRAAINWQSFHVGRDATVNFNQPGANAITLNRVVGHERSVIDGAINANGSVWILNSQGVLFNHSAQVNVGSLVATTLGMSDEAFMAGNTTFEGQGGPGSIINLGTLQAASEGHIALLGQHVANEGVIHATLGSAILAAGDKVSLNFNGNSLVGVTIERGVLNALIDNKHAIVADGGLVTLTAKGLDEVMRTVVNNTGEVRAQTLANREGRIFLLGGMEHDRIEVAGKLDASAPTGGNGGFIDTSAANVQIKEGLQVTTRAAAGQTGKWLIDPTDFFIEAGAGAQTSSSIGATTLSDALGNTDVTIQTVSTGSEAGDIHVNANVSWNSGTELTLEAHGDIHVNAHIAAGDESKVNLKTGWDGSTYDPSKTVRMKWNATTQSFDGKITFPESGGTWIGGEGYLTINGEAYTLIRSVNPGDMRAPTLGFMVSSLNGRFALAGNVDGTGWNSFDPIGTESTPFTGKFIGLGNTIDFLSIDRPEFDFVGLFGVTDGATISNVGLTNAIVNGYANVGTLIGMAMNTTIDNAHAGGDGVVNGNSSTGGLIGYLQNNSMLRNASSSVAVSGVSPEGEGAQSPSYIGGLVGYLYNQSTIEGSSASGAVTATDDPTDELSSIGGLVGYASDVATIRASSATGIVNAGATGYYVGGLVGYAAIVTIEDSHATGSVTGFTEVGGLVGDANDLVTITGSHATGVVTATGYFDLEEFEFIGSAGGLVGNMGEGNISDSYATGAVQAVSMVGGLVGKSSGSTITNSYATGAVTATGFIDPDEGVSEGRAGGLVGEMRGGSITGSYAEGNVIGTDDVGGLVGELRSSGEIANSHATGNVRGDWNVGGLAGRSRGGTITRSYATGNVTGDGPYEKQIGGLVGLNSGEITESYATGHVTGAEDVGGLIGGNYDGDISRSFATGSVTGVVSDNYENIHIGGLIGSNHGGAIIDSYATGAVSGATKVGGLIGYNYGYNPTPEELEDGWEVVISSITNSYAIGSVTGDTDVGGLVGDNTSGMIYDSFWNTQTSGQSQGVGVAGTVDGVTGKTTAEMKVLATYPLGDGGEIQGWDIVEDSSLSDVYPQLRWATSGLSAGVTVWVIGAGGGGDDGGGGDGSDGGEPPGTTPPGTGPLANQIAAVVATGTAPPASTPGEGAGDRLLPLSFAVGTPATPPLTGAGSGTGNVVAPLPSLTLPFSKPAELALVGAPEGDEPTNVVGLREAQQLLGDTGDADSVSTQGDEREVRVPVRRNSLARIVNGGVRLPGGVDQKLFVVRK